MTGAAGFVGSRVVRALLGAGFDVHAAVRDPDPPRLRGLSDVHLVASDLMDPAAVARVVEAASPDVCIHCAWMATPGEYLTSPANAAHVEAAALLARALVAAGCRRLVGLGTCFEYAPSEVALGESSPLGPLTPYARAKVAASERLARICEDTATGFAWARLFYLYGPGEDRRRLVPAVTVALLEGRRAPTTPGEQLRDFLHVDDVAHALVAVATSTLAGPVNIASGSPWTVREIVLAIGRATGRTDLLDIGAMPYSPGDPMIVTAEVGKLASTGFAPRWGTDEGLRDAVRWWSEHVASP